MSAKHITGWTFRIRHMALGLVLALLASQVATPCAARTPAKTQDKPTVHALLIEVNKYGLDGVPNLNGPQHDIPLMHDVLTKRFSIPESNIRVLSNPTHTQIRQAFADLKQIVKRGDIVYIHYSGHGSTADDAKDERQQDQTWIGYGARSKNATGDDQYDVLDKEIAVWMQPLYALTDDVVFVSDSCHSATVSRGGPMVRGGKHVGPVPLRDTLPDVPNPKTGLRIGAARDFESAIELDPNTGDACTDTSPCYGLFTWNWAQALQQSRPGESWGSVFNRAHAKTAAAQTTQQRPQMEGVADRAVFGGKYAAVARTLEVSAAGQDGTVTLNKGDLSGVSIGSIYTRAKAAGKPEATLEVVSVSPLESKAKVKTGSVAAGDLVEETDHTYSMPKTRLFVRTEDMSDAADWAGRLNKTLAEGAIRTHLSGFEFVNSVQQADWVLTLIRPEKNRAQGAQKSVSPNKLPAPDKTACTPNCAAPQLWVVSREDLLMDEHMRFDLSNYDSEVTRLVDNLGALSWSRQVTGLAAYGNNTPVKVSVTIYRPDNASQACPQSLNERKTWKHFGPFPLMSVTTPPRFGDCLWFELANTDKCQSWYGNVIAVGPTFAVQSILPSSDANLDESRIAPGQTISAMQTFYKLDQPGRETIMLLAADGAIDSATLGHAGLRGEQSPIDGILNAYQSKSGRGSVQKSSTWGVASQEFQVSKP